MLNLGNVYHPNISDVLDELPFRVRQLIVDSDMQFFIHTNEHIRRIHRIQEPHSIEMYKKDFSENYQILGFYTMRNNEVHLNEWAGEASLVHEIGHALDFYLGKLYYGNDDPISDSNFNLLHEYNESSEYITDYCKYGCTEWFAEGFRAFLNINDYDYTRDYGLVSREKLKEYAPVLENFFSKVFNM